MRLRGNCNRRAANPVLLGESCASEGSRRLQPCLAQALLCGKQEADHTDSRSWTNSRPNSHNAGSPTGRVRPMARQWSDVRTSRRQPRNRKRSTSWPNAFPLRGACSEFGGIEPTSPHAGVLPARTVTGAQPPLRLIDPPCPLSSSRRAFFSFVENSLVAAQTRGLRSMIRIRKARLSAASGDSRLLASPGLRPGGPCSPLTPLREP